MIVKREDYEELEVFKRLVPKMKGFIEDLSTFIRNDMIIGPDTAFVLTTESNVLSTLIDVYFNNKYSNPSTSMMLYNHLSLFQKNVKRMLELFIKFEELKPVMNKYQENGDTNEELQEIVNEGIGLITKTANSMIENLKHINSSIMGDYVRIEMGVNIMKEYKKRKQKNSLSEKDFMNEFTVKFKVLSNADRQFIEKEKIKNERHRNGTTDGGISKKV